MKGLKASGLALALIGATTWATFVASAADSPLLSLHLRRLVETEPRSDQWRQVEVATNWDSRGTAVVLCDMWDKHWCQGATARVGEMAPRMNQVVNELRRRGVLIIHCPSDTMGFYRDAAGRKLAQAAPKVDLQAVMQQCLPLQPQSEPPLPIDDSDGGCDEWPQCQTRGAWSREIGTLQIEEGDAITDSAEAYNLMHQRGITNVIVMGVHENMCILGRSFAIRQMVKLGQNVVLMRDLTDTMYNSRRRPWVDHFTGTDLVAWHIEKYWCPTITSDQIIGGQPFRFAADSKPPRVFHNYVKVPGGDVHWQQVASYVEETPHPDYQQASNTAREAFRDLKFGVRIHWGVYALLGVDASWPFLGMSNPERQSYQQLYQQFNPVDFDADAWMGLFQQNGLKVFAFTSKHHDGFSMFDTKTRVARRMNWAAPGGPQMENCDLSYSIMEGPFKRDIVKELTDSAHRHGIKVDLYFSHPDWYDTDFRPFAEHPLHDRISKTGQPEQWDHFTQRHRQQLTELLSNYGKIDMICLDQYFDATAWPDLRETMKSIRQIQPDVMFRARGIGNYGDYYTPEGFVPGAKANTTMPWMVIYPLAGIWSYQPDTSKYQNGGWILQNLVDTVAKGGNFMVGIGPDAKGKFHPKAIEALGYAGAWLRVNGEAIYNTRPREGEYWKEGDAVRYTRTKDKQFTYALALRWPGTSLALSSVRARAGSEVRLLGVKEPLTWRNDEELGLVIEIPSALQEAAKRPCQQAYAFKIEGQTREMVMTPRLIIDGPSFGESETVRVDRSEPGVAIRYTKDGSDPTRTAPLYTGPLSLPKGTTLKARGFKAGAAPSEVAAIKTGALRINFQPAASRMPVGFMADTGQVFGARGAGWAYGWLSDQTDQTRQRATGQVADTLCHFRTGQKWELGVPNGKYEVTVGVGDCAFESENTINVEGVSFYHGLKLVKETKEATKAVEVRDGRLTIDSGDAADRSTKITHVIVVRE